ncbi:hypothetical protein T484DRAFT_1620551, partial [Baffinella frigidus]
MIFVFSTTICEVRGSSYDFKPHTRRAGSQEDVHRAVPSAEHLPCWRYPPLPYTLHPTPCTLHPAPYTLHPTPYTLHPAPCTLHPTP